MRGDAELNGVVRARVAIPEADDLDEPLPPVHEAGHVEHSWSDQAAHRRSEDGLEQRLVEEVHLARGGDAVSQELGATKGPAPVDVVGSEPSLARPQDLVQEPLERHVLGRSAKQRHRGMAMGVDQARHQQPAQAPLLTSLEWGHLLSWPDPGYAAVDYVQAPGPVDRGRGIAGDDGVGVVSRRAGLRRSFGYRGAQRTDRADPRML